MTGASLRDRAVAATPSSPAVSTVPASIPSAGWWIVVESYGFDVWQVVKVTGSYVFFTRGTMRRSGRVDRSKVVYFSATEDEAKQVAHRLKSAAGERDRRTRAAHLWFRGEVGRICAASAMSARSAETAGLSPQDASAAPQADAQTPGATHA